MLSTMSPFPVAGWKVHSVFGSHCLVLKESFLTASIEQCRKWVSDNHLDINGTFFHVTRTTRGADESTPTLKRYHEKYEELFKFCCVIGDWRSACLFGRHDNGDRRVCPSKPWSARPETLVKFMRWKSWTKNTPLTFNNSPVCDVYGVPMKCVGHWHDPGNIDQLFAAVGSLHRIYDDLCTDTYSEVCNECVTLNSNVSHEEQGHTIWRSCRAHSGSPKLRPYGNPMYARVLNAEKIQMKKKLASEHIRKGNIRLLPGHVRDLRNYLWCKGDIYGMMLYVMNLVGISLFLRASELLAIKSSDFIRAGHIVKPHGVSSLVIKIQGKNDDRPVYMKLFRNDECPDLCPVRHLLFYVEAAGLDGDDSYLFLPKKAIMDISLGKICHNAHIGPMSYPSWLAEMKNMISTVIPEVYHDETSTIGTHTLRKVGYLFAVWGTLKTLSTFEREATRQPMDKNGEVNPHYPTVCYSDITAAARHKSIATAALYIQNSTMLFWTIQEQGDLWTKNRVATWKMNYIGVSMSAVQSISAYSHAFQFPLFKQAEFFIEKELGLPLLKSENREQRLVVSFGDVDAKLTDLATVNGILNGQEKTLINLLNEKELPPSFITKVVGLVHDMQRNALVAGREGAKRVAEQHSSSSDCRKQQRVSQLMEVTCTPRTQQPTQHSPTVLVTPPTVLVTPPAEKRLGLFARLEITRDLGHWRTKWSRMKKSKSKADRRQMMNFLRALAEIPRCEMNDAARQWKLRVLKVLESFENCVMHCYAGDEGKFCIGRHKGVKDGCNKCTCDKGD